MVANVHEIFEFSKYVRKKPKNIFHCFYSSCSLVQHSVPCSLFGVASRYVVFKASLPAYNRGYQPIRQN